VEKCVAGGEARGYIARDQAWQALVGMVSAGDRARAQGARGPLGRAPARSPSRSSAWRDGMLPTQAGPGPGGGIHLAPTYGSRGSRIVVS
jgi:hypothetical protein